jgi:UDP-N-acetylglucosamine--N-acetylmuramyl-(pentapeptide) pyrophosphoryl-undecaprenol N-acetylglucosamine transferase
MKKTICIYAGRTGGHFYPAFSFAKQISVYDPKIETCLLLTEEKYEFMQACKQKKISTYCFPFDRPSHFVPHIGLECFFQYLKMFLRSIAFFSKKSPQLLVSFGSAASIPIVLAASFLGIPIMLHEQNVVPGRANQFLAFWAKRVGVSFVDSMKWFSRQSVFFSGFPVRPSFDHKNGLFLNRCDHTNSSNLLVFGGSQGAKSINRNMVLALDLLKTQDKIDFTVTHITGEQDFVFVRSEYERLRIRATVYKFYENIFEKIAWSDVVVARSGAGTIFELAAVGRASILIPYPHARAHQEANAINLEQQGAARLIVERDLSPKLLRNLILPILKSKKERSLMEQRIHEYFHQNAANEILEEGLKISNYE